MVAARLVTTEIAAISFRDSNGDGKGVSAGNLLQRTRLILGGQASMPYGSTLDLSISHVSTLATTSLTSAWSYPMFGSMADFLIACGRKLHARNLRLDLDFVPNDIFYEHAWLRESRSSWSKLRKC